MQAGLHNSDHSSEFAVLLRKAADYCASGEHCIFDVQQKLSYWGADRYEAEKIITTLSKEGFMNEERYAKAFATDKFRLLKWGKVKIASELRYKQINISIIESALESIDDEDYKECAVQLVHKKQHELKSNTPQNKQKIIRYMLGKGFEMEVVLQILNER